MGKRSYTIRRENLINLESIIKKKTYINCQTLFFQFSFCCFIKDPKQYK
jgi:hypothetical protein